MGDLVAVSFGGAIRPRRGRRRRDGWWEARPGSWVIARDGKPVSHIRVVYNVLSVYGCQLKIASIGGVCTHPDYRRRGIAGALLDHCIEVAADAGASLLLISGERGLYRRAMAVDAGPTYEVEVRPGSVKASTRTPQARAPQARAPRARRAAPGDWVSCARLHQREPVRFVRSAGFFARAFSGHGGRGAWVIECGGEVAAYVLLSRPWGTPRDHPRRLATEYAGSRAALVEGLPSLFESSGFERITFRAPQWDREMAYLFRRAGLDGKPATLLDHTIRLLDLPRLMRRLRPYVAARLLRAESRRLTFEQEGHRCVFALGDEMVELGLKEACALVLGGPEAPQVEGELGRVLAALFPLPCPLPGMNYV
ncbi:MAG: GNAT family N-acetyltransferase [Armatimonadota bacterium]|nr:MAG: GNAT family N-acetyltransferase [Armatimonadota bacterium]